MNGKGLEPAMEQHKVQQFIRAGILQTYPKPYFYATSFQAFPFSPCSSDDADYGKSAKEIVIVPRCRMSLCPGQLNSPRCSTEFQVETGA